MLLNAKHLNGLIYKKKEGLASFLGQSCQPALHFYSPQKYEAIFKLEMTANFTFLQHTKTEGHFELDMTANFTFLQHTKTMRFHHKFEYYLLIIIIIWD